VTLRNQHGKPWFWWIDAARLLLLAVGAVIGFQYGLGRPEARSGSRENLGLRPDARRRELEQKSF
jgi:hypothetical protein